MSVGIVVAADGAAWEATLLTAVERGDLGITVVRRCIDVVELVSFALTGQADVALVAGRLRGLDADIVDQLLVAGVVPVAVLVGDPDREAELARAQGIGHIVGVDADPSVVASVVRDAAGTPAPATDTRHAYALPGPARTTVEVGAATTPHPVPDGSVLAVWGPTGAPGRTTVAAALADEIARLGVDVVLIDADVYGGTLAIRFGVLDESPGLAAACRLAGTGLLDSAALAELSWQLGPRLRLLTGIPLAQRWPEIRPSALESVLRVARGLGRWVVIDLGFALEADEELSFDTVAPRRNGATLTVLESADVVLAVGDCDPVGLQRLANGLIELEEAGLAGSVHVVLNKVRPGFGPAAAEQEAAAALQRFSSRSPAACLPYERDTVDASLAAGRALGELDRRSRLRQAFVQLAQDLTGIEARSRRRHARA